MEYPCYLHRGELLESLPSSGQGCESEEIPGYRWHISSTLVVPGNWSHRVGTRKLGSMRRLVRLIKCREVGGDLKLLGFKA